MFIIPFAFYFLFNSKILDPVKHRGPIIVLSFHNILKNMNGLSSMKHMPLLAYEPFHGFLKMVKKSKRAKYFYSKTKWKETHMIFIAEHLFIYLFVSQLSEI